MRAPSASCRMERWDSPLVAVPAGPPPFRHGTAVGQAGTRGTEMGEQPWAFSIP
jgi:hypothetical protein